MITDWEQRSGTNHLFKYGQPGLIRTIHTFQYKIQGLPQLSKIDHTRLRTLIQVDIFLYLLTL